VTKPFAQVSLLIANFMVGAAILGPAGMLPALEQGFGISVATAGLMVTVGGVVLCIGSPLMVWATSHIERRTLLTGALVAVGLGQLASAVALSYPLLLALRVVSMIFAALVTPHAASTVALMVPERERSAAIVFVFLGFSLAIAGGLPLVTFISTHAGWQLTFVALGAGMIANGLLLFCVLPGKLRGGAISLQSWAGLFGRKRVLLLLLLTTTHVTAQFTVFTYLAPLLIRLAHAGSGTVGLFFLIFGITGVLGNLIAARLVATLNPYRTSVLAIGAMLVGLSVWSAGAGEVTAMGVGIACWGLGFASINSMQQARLVTCAPELSSASVSLNTSSVYIGQAIGSALGGVLLTADMPRTLGYAAVVVMAIALGLLTLTRDLPGKPADC
jgi:DHA1 family inner membrane transport protein